MVASLSFTLKKTAEAVFLSPVFPFLLIAYGLLTARSRVHRRLFYAWCGLLSLVFFSTPLTVNWLAKGLENYQSVTVDQLKTAQAIVILGGGTHAFAREYDGPTPDGILLERLRYGARLAKETGLPVLVTGGAPEGMEPEARLMALSLKGDFGVTVRWTESRSLDTEDNAFYSAEILKKAGVKRIALVTTALHMRRSVTAFRQQGLDVIPAPTAFISDSSPKKMIYDYLPNPTSAQQGWAVVHEWVGIFVQKIKNGIGL